MATIKKAKNLSAGPSKKTPKAGPVDPKGQWTGVQKRTLGNMKKGGVVKKAQTGEKVDWGTAPAMAGLSGKKGYKKKVDAAKSNYESSTNPKVEYSTPKRKYPGGMSGGQKVSVDTTGMAAGERRFPAKVTMRSGKDVYYPINKPSAKRAIKYSQKNGGKTSKKK